MAGPSRTPRAAVGALVLALVLLAPLAPSGHAARLVPTAGHVAGAPAAAPWVVAAQRRLNQLGCSAGPVDGRVGSWTRSAVVRFQSRHRLVRTGQLDERTRRLLHSPRAQRCDRRPVPAGSGTGRRIVLSQHQNWLWLVGPRGGVLAQGGIIDNPQVLRRGAHATGSYCGRPARVLRNSDYGGSLWLDHFVRFAPCGIGFHRIPRHKSNGAQIHPDWYLGTDMAASHGCVRLSARMAAAVWRFTVHRTPVRVV